MEVEEKVARVETAVSALDVFHWRNFANIKANYR